MKFNQLRSWSLVCLCIFLAACGGGYDHEIEEPDGFGGGYNLTPLGRLVWGPLEASKQGTIYNTKVFLNDSEISSKAAPYTEIQKDLVFQLHKGGTLEYWLHSEIGSTEDTTYNQGTTIITPRPPKGDQLKKVYSDGYWSVNFKDSNIVIHFGKNGIPELRDKFSLKDGMHFWQSYYFDSVYNGKVVKLKRVNTVCYEMIREIAFRFS